MVSATTVFLLSPSHFFISLLNSGCWRHLDLIRHSEVLKNSYSYNIFHTRTFFPNSKFQLICIKIIWAMENSCLAAILILSAILFFCSNFFIFLFFYLWFELRKCAYKKWWNTIKKSLFGSVLIRAQFESL
jgi:ABC-type multidrug transport system permease subunit